MFTLVFELFTIARQIVPRREFGSFVRESKEPAPMGKPLRNKLLAAVFFLVLLGQLRGAAGQEWTRFHGPYGSGESDATTVPDTWSDKDYNWQVELPGRGHSSPVLWGDKIFLVNGDPTN